MALFSPLSGQYNHDSSVECFNLLKANKGRSSLYYKVLNLLFEVCFLPSLGSATIFLRKNPNSQATTGIGGVREGSTTKAISYVHALAVPQEIPAGKVNCLIRRELAWIKSVPQARTGTQNPGTGMLAQGHDAALPSLAICPLNTHFLSLIPHKAKPMAHGLAYFLTPSLALFPFPNQFLYLLDLVRVPGLRGG